MDVVRAKARHGARTWRGGGAGFTFSAREKWIFFFFFTWHLRGYFKAAFSELFVRPVGTYIYVHTYIQPYIQICLVVWPSSLKGVRNEYSR